MRLWRALRRRFCRHRRLRYIRHEMVNVRLMWCPGCERVIEHNTALDALRARGA